MNALLPVVASRAGIKRPRHFEGKQPDPGTRRDGEPGGITK